MKKYKSDFGKGLTYCLGLFLAHAERDLERGINPESQIRRGWYNASSDHLYDMVIPENLPKSLKNRLIKFRTNVLDKGHGSGLLKEYSEKDINNSINEAKELLILIDRSFGIKSQKAEWT